MAETQADGLAAAAAGELGGSEAQAQSPDMVVSKNIEVVSPFEALEEFQRKAESGAYNKIEKADEGVEIEGATVIATRDDGVDAPAVSPGSMRLQGNFKGSATTATHQLELEVGMDLEMPSHVAAEAMHQLAARSRSASPLPIQGFRALEAERPTMFSSLASFFRRDAREAQARAGTAKLSLPELQLTLQDPDSAAIREEAARMEKDRNHLVLELSLARGKCVQLEKELADAADEREDLLAKLEGAEKERGTRDEHVDDLRKQADLALQGHADLSAQLNEREAEVRTLEVALSKNRQELELMRAERDAYVAAKDGNDGDGVARTRSENEALQAQVGALHGEIASLHAQLEAAAANGAAAQGADEIRERSRVLMAERDEAREQLALASKNAATAQERIAELETQVGTMAAALAEAQHIAEETAKRHEETVEHLGRVNEELFARAITAEQVAEKLGRDGGASASPRMSEEAMRKELRAEVDGEVRALRASTDAARTDRDRAREQAAAAGAAQAAAEAEASHVKVAAERLRKEKAELMVRTGALAGEKASFESMAKALREEIASAKAGAEASNAENGRLSAEVKRLQAVAKAFDSARVQGVEAEELRRLRAEESAAHTQAAQASERRVQASSKEAAAANDRAAKALVERDAARRELRDATQGGLGERARVQEELHKAQQQATRAQILEEEVSRLRRRCAGLESARNALAQELNSIRSPGPMTTAIQAQPPLHQQDSNSCLMHTVKQFQVSSPSGSAVAAPPAYHMPSTPTNAGSPVTTAHHIAATPPAPAGAATVTTVPMPSLSMASLPQPVGTTPGLYIGSSFVAPRPMSASFVAAPPTLSGPPGPPSPTGTAHFGSMGSPLGSGVISPRMLMAAQPRLFNLGAPPLVTWQTAAGPVQAKMTLKVTSARRIQH